MREMRMEDGTIRKIVNEIINPIKRKRNPKLASMHARIYTPGRYTNGPAVEA